MRRKFRIELDIIDNEAPNETNEESAKSLKDYIVEQLGELAYKIKNIEVSPVDYFL